MLMINQLLSHIQQFATLNDSEIELLSQYLEPIYLNRKDILHQPDRHATHKYFVCQGCLRSYFVNDKGVEQILQFAIENWWIGDYESLERKIPSSLFIDAVEDSQVLAFAINKEEELLRQIPQLERYFRIIFQRERTAHLTKLRYTFEFSREEAYVHLLQSFPQFIERVPDYMIASFLNLTPEYLSKIRKRIVS